MLANHYTINSERVPSVPTETNRVFIDSLSYTSKIRKPTTIKVLKDIFNSNACYQSELASYCGINNSQNQDNINKHFEK